MTHCGKTGRALVLIVLVALAAPVTAVHAAGPVVGTWATYRWTSSLTQEMPVFVRQAGPGGQVTWSVVQESASPLPLFVTYSIVQDDPKTYTMQIVTHQTLDGPPLSVTQVQVDRTSGKALRSVIQRPKGVIETPESGLRPFRQADVTGTEETAAVPAGRFSAIRTPYQNGTVWVSDQVPALGLVKAIFPSGTLELVRSDTSGAKDLLHS
ncbi:MAG: hypothetical protein HY002_02920 [Candidatus Rokubacteria bacterium]|nr:hypothetical protein [Candidatus Rokubacteria bacterium]